MNAVAVALGGLVTTLAADDALDSDLTGAKAASLARAARAGMATLDGVVLTTKFTAATDAGSAAATFDAIRRAFELAGGSDRSLVVRSSSTVEDARDSSMAGQFESVIDVRGFDAFCLAVTDVLDSRIRAGVSDSPIAVLIQPFIRPEFGGVLFGVDPVSGRSDRRVVSAVAGGPDRLVSGEVQGSRYLLDLTGKVRSFTPADGPKLPRAHLRRLTALAAAAAAEFGGPQDIEWAITDDDDLWLLQSRFVTTDILGVPAGAVYGPGPVAETFPEPLTALEQDLWVPPLAQAVRAAVLVAGTATRARVDAGDPVVAVAGQVAIDLELAGEIRPKRAWWSRLNPVPPVRQLRAAWRVGRLRAAVPDLGEHLLAQVDADLEALPSLDHLSNRQLIALLHRSGGVLRALHAHEILIGMLTDTGHNRMTGASVALRILDEARREGMSDAAIVAASPAVLALAPPHVGPRDSLPSEALSIPLGTDCENANDNGILREALRLRVRWVQELSGRAAWLIGERLTDQGAIEHPGVIRHMTLAHLEAVVTHRAVVVPGLLHPELHRAGPSLPARFQLSDEGRPVRVERSGATCGGTGAGGGTGRGPVTHDAVDPPPGSVLVTTTLQPGLGPLLGHLEAIVAETGSVLSHLAILAREAGVATVVGFPNATDELAEGVMVTVDGMTGQVVIVPEEDR
ncbi:MAG TPA: PEP/pyruvate-binding domain-containing protein [Acidimicrobiales bacterium]|nr:PEP/pyruvate-binding domain-containing protein [Acidimicrobiales bacterium]